MNALSYGTVLGSPSAADEPLTGDRVGDRGQLPETGPSLVALHGPTPAGAHRATIDEAALAAARAGAAALAGGRVAEARGHYARAASLGPNEPAFQIGLADVAEATGQAALEKQHLREAVRLAPHDVIPQRRLALIALADGDVETALACSTRARELAPGDLVVASVHATVLEAVGRVDEAWQLAQEVIRANWCSTHLAATYAKLAPRHGQGPIALRVLQTMMARPSIRSDYRLHLQFAAGDLLDRMRRYDEAFAYYRQANGAKGATFNSAAHSAWTDEMIAAFAPERWRAAPRADESSELPVFIVGMPRSGTTLVEQILATHPAVHGAGELTVLSDVMEALPRLVPGAVTLADYVDRLSPEAVGRLSAEFLAALRSKAAADPGVLRVTDKNPVNFLHLGWIGLIFPKARIIHCVRSPLDTCLSCYTTHFGGRHDYAYDLNHLGRFYREYRRLMDHWRALPDRPPILDVSYEQLVADPEAQTRRLLEFAGLPWDERCLRFHENRRYVHTTSYSQVRQPLYASSVGRWRNYERHLGPLRESLGNLAK